MFSLRLADGSRRGFPFLFCFNIHHVLCWSFWRELLHLHHSPISHHIRVLDNHPRVSQPYLDHSYRAFRSCWGIDWRHADSSDDNPVWLWGSFYLLSTFPELLVRCSRVLLAEVSIITFSGLFFGYHCLKDMMAQSKSSSDTLVWLSGYIPMFVVLLSFFTFDRESQFYKDHAVWFFISLALSFSFVSTKLVVSTMSKMHYSPLQPEAFLIYTYWILGFLDLGVSPCVRLALTFGPILILYLIFVYTAIN